MSGGEQQMLAIGRAMMAKPRVLLLDEPTEGLDPETADAVLADVLSATEGQSVVLVTHRLAGLAGFDEVVVLDVERAVMLSLLPLLLDTLPPSELLLLLAAYKPLPFLDCGCGSILTFSVRVANLID